MVFLTDFTDFPIIFFLQEIEIIVLTHLKNGVKLSGACLGAKC